MFLRVSSRNDVIVYRSEGHHVIQGSIGDSVRNDAMYQCLVRCLIANASCTSTA